MTTTVLVLSVLLLIALYLVWRMCIILAERRQRAHVTLMRQVARQQAELDKM